MPTFHYKRTVERHIVEEEHQDVSVEADTKEEAEEKLRRGEGNVTYSFGGNTLGDTQGNVIDFYPDDDYS